MEALRSADGKPEAADRKRRTWSEEERELIVRASLKKGTTVNAVARLYGVQPWQIYDWRKRAREAALQSKPATLVPVHVTEHDPTDKAEPKQSCSVVVESQAVRITITGLIDAGIMRMVLECLAR
jgi:transposase-like protein